MARVDDSDVDANFFRVAGLLARDRVGDEEAVLIDESACEVVRVERADSVVESRVEPGFARGTPAVVRVHIHVATIVALHCPEYLLRADHVGCRKAAVAVHVAMHRMSGARITRRVAAAERVDV